MQNYSHDSAQSMIAAIIEREQKEARVPPRYISAINQVWAARNRNTRLEPVLAELAAGGRFDKFKFDEAVARHEEEVREYLEERQAEIDENLAAHTKIYRETLANTKAALDKIAVAVSTGNISPATNIVLDQPVAVFGQPAAFVVDEHIESWNSWAKVVWSSVDQYGIEKVRFWYSWHNDSADDVAIISATSYLTVAGKCSLHVDPTVFTNDSTNLWFTSNFTIYTGTRTIEGTDEPDIASFEASADSNIGGGTAHTDVHYMYNTVNLGHQQAVSVQANEPVVFSVDMLAHWVTYYGNVKLEFDQEPFVNSPYLSIVVQPLGG
jgi:hypothetical protein